MCSAWATSRPSRSKRAQEESRLSLILGEKLDRRRTTPISSATDVRAFLTISNVRGSSNSERVLNEILGCIMVIQRLNEIAPDEERRVTLPTPRTILALSILLTLSLIAPLGVSRTNNPQH